MEQTEQVELTESQGTQVGWQDYLAIIVRRKWYFIIPCVTIFLSSLVMGLFMPRIYRAETAVLIQEPNIMNPLIQGLAVSSSVGARLGVLREDILSWTSLSRLVEDLKLDKTVSSPIAFEGLIKGLQSTIEVRMRGREILMIAYEHEDPRMAQQVVNSISGIFLERNMAAETAETESAIGFIGKEMDVYKTELEDAEKKLREFQELNAAELPVAEQLNRQVVEMQTQLAELLVENTELHPAVVAIRRRVEEMKKRRNEEIKRFVATSIAKGQDPKAFEEMLKSLEQPGQAVQGLDPEKVKLARDAYGALIDRMEGPATTKTNQQVQIVPSTIQGQNPRLEMSGSPTSISLSPWQEQRMAQLTRDYQVQAGTYQHLQERMQRAKITRRLGESDEGLKFKILEPARLPLRPYKPNMMKLALFGLFLGAFVGAGVVFLVEYLDQSFQSSEELQTALAIPVLGSIATIITEADLEAQRERMKHWLSIKNNTLSTFRFLREKVGGGVDRFLVRWKV